MFRQDLEKSNGGRTVVGIDPSSEFLQLAILTPEKEVQLKKLPLSPSITEEIIKSTEPSMTQIAIESYGSYGKLFVCGVSARFGPHMMFLKRWFAYNKITLGGIDEYQEEAIA